jgi:GntR family transcriptional regulator
MSIALKNRVSKNAPLPLYHQVKAVLLESIETGQLTPDQQLPSESALAKRFEVSQITIRQALRDLAGLGYVRREQGRGTFVARPKLDQGPRELTSFTEEMRRHRLTSSSRMVKRSIQKADVLVAERLELPAGEAVLVLARLRYADGEPMGLQTAHLPLSLVPGLIDDLQEDASLYELLRSRYGLDPARARETYFAVAADAVAAGLLGIATGSPIFSVERVTLLADGRPFEFVQSAMRGDRYSILLDLSANRAPQASRAGGTT